MVGVLDGGFDIPGPADAQHTLVVDTDAIVVTKVIIEPPIALVRALLIDFLNLVSQTLIFLSPTAQFPGSPFVVGGTGYMEQFAGRFDGIPLLLMALLDGRISLAVSYFRKASLQGNSIYFFAKRLTPMLY